MVAIRPSMFTFSPPRANFYSGTEAVKIIVELYYAGCRFITEYAYAISALLVYCDRKNKRAFWIY